MREIKFRAWDGILKQWICSTGYYCDGINYWFLAPSAKNPAIAQAKHHMVVGESIMQFTGLHDKNGKEIYEGDVVRWYVNDVTRTGIVHWVEDSACFDLKHFHDEYHVCNDWYRGKYEVLGNIYENPELLEVAA